VVGLDGDEGAVDGGERQARELVSGGVPRVVAERGRYQILARPVGAQVASAV
jgi:hypothetical protein